MFVIHYFQESWNKKISKNLDWHILTLDKLKEITVIIILILLFQHFLAQSLQDEKLRADISDFIPSGIEAAFENDIQKSTNDLITVVVDNGFNEFKKEINLFFKGLTSSEYKKFQPVYQIIFDNLQSRKNRFDFINIVESSNENRIAKIELGNILRNNYSNDNLTESEFLVFEELSKLIAAQQKDEEVKRKAEGEIREF